MVQVPLSQEALQGGALPAFRAGRVAPVRSATGGQIQQLGRAVQLAGTSAANIADVLQDDLDTAKTKEAYALWNDENRLALHGTGPDLGYLNKQGKAATGDARINTQNRIARNAKTFAKGLDNKDQRAMFEQAVQARTGQINQQLDVHEARAIRVFGIGESKALSEEAAGDAVDARTLPVPLLETFLAQKQLSINEAQKAAEMLGYGPEQTEALVLDTTTAIHVGVIDRFIKQGSPDMAQSYFQEVDQDEISTAARTKLAGLMRVATINDRATDQSNEIIDEVDREAVEIVAAQERGEFAVGQDPIRLDADDRRVEALRILRERDMPDAMRQATRQRLETFYKDETAREATVQADLLSRSQTFLARNPTKGVTDLEDADQAELQRTGLWAGINRFADTGRYGSNPDAYGTFLGMSDEALLAIESKQELFRDMLGLGMKESHRNQILAAWDAARDTTGAPPDRILTIPRVVRALGLQHGLVPETGNPTPQNARILMAIEEEANRRVAAAETAQGAQPRADELKQLVNSAFIDMKVTFDAGPFTNEVFALRSQLTQAQLEGTEINARLGGGFAGFGGVGETFRDVRVPGLGDEEVRLPLPVNDLIIERLRAAGEPITDAAIIELWINAGRPQTVAEVGGL